MSAPAPKSESVLRCFLASFGIGATQVEIHTFGTQHPRGSGVEGRVILRGGEVTQRFSELSLQLRSFAHGDFPTTLSTQVLARNLSLTPQFIQHIHFLMPIPDNALLSRVVGRGRQGCVLVARAATVGDWVSPQGRIALNVTVHREIEAVLCALRGMGFVEQPWFSRHMLRPDENLETTAVFRPPAHLQEQLETLSIFTAATCQMVHGKVLIELRPHSLGGHVKGLVGSNKQQHPFQIPCDVLLTADGQPNPFGALPYVKQILSLALTLPDDPKSWMLRPSMTPPAAPETLLRPAGPIPTVSSENLLRPTTPPEENKA